MWWPPHYWRKDYHQFNGAKILLSHTHEGITSSRANDDPPLFSLDNGKLVPHGIEPLTSHSAIQSFCQLNQSQECGQILLSHPHEGMFSCDDPPLFFLDNGQLVPQGTEPLTCNPKLLSTEWANLQPQFYCNVLYQTFTFVIA